MENEAGLKLLFWIGTIVMIFSALGVLLITILYQKKVYKIRKKESDNLLKVSLESEKRERKRIASDLHDGVSGDLNAIRNYITVLYQKEQDPSNKHVLEEVKPALDNMLISIQNISYNLMPPLLDTQGLVPTLKDYFDRIKKWNTITINSRYYQKDIPVSSSDAYELYRIIQELISNMLKHGNSSRIDFSIEKNEKILEIKIADDGIPFDLYKSLHDTSGMGLKNIISRAKYIGASLTQVPADKGNIILIRLKK